MRANAVLKLAAVFLAVLVAGSAVAEDEEDKKGPVLPEGAKGAEMVLVPAGEFGMGCNRRVDRHCDKDEYPYHQVYLDAYYIDVTEVTNEQYDACSDAGTCRPAPKYADFDGPDQPAVGVSWDDAVTYCEWAGKKLATEAQWEKAARGENGLVYPWGNYNCGCNCAIQEERQLYGCGKEHTWPVGSLPKGASPYGALDMAGNALEWVYDWYDPDYYDESPDKNPAGPKEGDVKVKKGGCHAHIRNYLRTSDRTTAKPESVSNSTSFRCVMPLPKPGPGKPAPDGADGDNTNSGGE